MFWKKAEDKRALQRRYAEQRSTLEARAEGPGAGAFVSPFEILRDPRTGKELSYAPWPENVPALLPKADCVALTGTSGGRRWSIVVPWGEIERLAPTLLTPVPSTEPPRFLATPWPAAASIEALRRVAVLTTG